MANKKDQTMGLTFELRMVTRQQSRSCQYNKRDWERLINPILQHIRDEGGTTELTWNVTPCCTYRLSFRTKEQALATRRKITEACNMLHRNASYGWLPIQTD
jgi:hypothetical protein